MSFKADEDARDAPGSEELDSAAEEVQCSELAQAEQCLRIVLERAAQSPRSITAIRIRSESQTFVLSVIGQQGVREQLERTWEQFKLQCRIACKHRYWNKKRVEPRLHSTATVKCAKSEDGDVTVLVFTYERLLDVNRALREALALARFSMQFRDFCFFRTSRGLFRIYVVLDGASEDLENDILSRKKAGHWFDEDELLQMLENLGTVLQREKQEVRNTQGFPHGDIKPEHIVRTDTGDFKLVDFWPLWLGCRMYPPGTPTYCSPEMKVGETKGAGDYDVFAADIFALGMTVFHAALLRRPHREGAENCHALRERLDDEVSLIGYSPGLRALLMQMMETRPTTRPCAAQLLRRTAECKEELHESRLAEADRLFEEAGLCAAVNNFQKAIQLYTAAEGIYERYFPADERTSFTHFALADVLKSAGNLEKAIENFTAGLILFIQKHPGSQKTAKLFIALSTLYEALGVTDLALEQLKAAEAILSNSEVSSSYASCLQHYGIVYHLRGEFSEAFKKFSAAHQVLSLHFADSNETASNLMNWAEALEQAGQLLPALCKREIAHAVLSRFFPRKKATAMNLEHMAALYVRMQQPDQALLKYEEADEYFMQFFPLDVDTARHFWNWGIVLANLGRKNLALAKFAEARRVYTDLGLFREAAECKRRMRLELQVRCDIF